MKVYEVGGAIRDEMLGRPVQDRDFVVVGATPESMVELGYQPVGRDFPVFLHPKTHEEYALARTERKSGRGYKGFTVQASPTVTLEEDLARRDLTINAMARDDSGRLIDPFGGAADLRRGVLRHVSPAFEEDPVRILRVARFAARFGFAVAEDTMALMRRMVDVGEADHLVPERVWQEVAKGLMEKRPSAMFDVLAESGALARIAPEWEHALDARRDTGAHALAVLDRAAANGAPLTVRFALAAMRAGAAAGTLCTRLRAPNECRDLALLCVRALAEVRIAPLLDAAERVALLHLADAWRRRARLGDLLDAAALDDGVPPGEYRPAHALVAAFEATLTVDTAALAADRADARSVPERIRDARIAAVKRLLEAVPRV
jgi:tRNA nucleotidyltransferase (CCA-adding enzyme)